MLEKNLLYIINLLMSNQINVYNYNNLAERDLL